MRYRWFVAGALLLGLSRTAAAEDVVWANAVGVSVSGSSLTKTGGTGWNAGAGSTGVIRFGYGYVEFTATETTTYRICGLGNTDSDQNYTDVDFGIIVRSDGSFGVYEAGTHRGDFGINGVRRFG